MMCSATRQVGDSYVVTALRNTSETCFLHSFYSEKGFFTLVTILCTPKTITFAAKRAQQAHTA